MAAFWGYRELPSAPFGPPLLLPCGLGTHGPLLAADRLPDPPSSGFVSVCQGIVCEAGLGQHLPSILPAARQAAPGPTDPLPG